MFVQRFEQRHMRLKKIPLLFLIVYRPFIRVAFQVYVSELTAHKPQAFKRVTQRWFLRVLFICFKCNCFNRGITWPFYPPTNLPSDLIPGESSILIIVPLISAGAQWPFFVRFGQTSISLQVARGACMGKQTRGLLPMSEGQRRLESKHGIKISFFFFLSTFPNSDKVCTVCI